MRRLGVPMTEQRPPGMGNCSGVCVTAADLGVIVSDPDAVAYPHPMCPEHGDPHPFVWNGKFHDTHDGVLRLCGCGAYEDEHSAAVSL